MDHSLKMLPIYSVLLLFVSYINIAFFYGYFGIDISNYVDLTELFILSLPVFQIIFYALFLACFPVILAGFFAFLGFAFQPQRKMVLEVVDEQRNERTSQESVAMTNSDLIEKVKKEMGFHLADEILELKALYISASEKKKFWTRLVRTTLITIGFLFMTYKSIDYFIGELNEIKNHSKEFIENPHQVIFILFLSFIAGINSLLQLFSPKMLWQTFFKPMFGEKGLPIVIFAIYMIVSLLFSYSKIQKLNYTNQTEYYNVYLKDRVIKTDNINYKFIGRTKGFMFLLKNNNVKIVNISDADSIILSR